LGFDIPQQVVAARFIELPVMPDKPVSDRFRKQATIFWYKLSGHGAQHI